MDETAGVDPRVAKRGDIGFGGLTKYGTAVGGILCGMTRHVTWAGLLVDFFSGAGPLHRSTTAAACRRQRVRRAPKTGQNPTGIWQSTANPTGILRELSLKVP